MGIKTAFSKHLRVISTLSLAIMMVGICLFVIGQNVKSLDGGSEGFDQDLLERWNRNTAYDSIQMYLQPRYQVWQTDNPSNIAKTIKYYINGYWHTDISRVKDTLDKYESIIRQQQGEALTLRFFDLQRAQYLMYVGQWDEAKEIAEQAANLDVLIEVFPKLASDAMGMASFISMQYGELKEAIDYNERSDSILISNFGEEFYGRILTLNNFSLLADQMGKYQEGLAYTLQTLNIVNKYYAETHENRFKVLNTLGLKYQALGQFDEAIRIFKEAIQMNLDQNIDVNLFGLYMNLSSSYIGKQDYENGEKYHALGESSLRGKPGDQTRYEIEINLRRAGMLIDLERGEEALPYIDKIRKIISERYSGEEYYLIDVYALFYLYDMGLKNYDSAGNHIQKYLSLLSMYEGESNEKWAHGLAWKADVLKARMAYDSAHHYLDRAIEIYGNTFKSKHKYYLETLLLKAEIFMDEEKYEDANQILNTILSIDQNQIAKSEVFNLPPYDSLFKHPILSRTLLHKVDLVDVDDESADLDKLQLKATLYEYLGKEFDRLLALFGGFNSRDDLFSDSEKIFKKAIANSYKLYQKTKDPKWIDIGFKYAGRTRALQFQEIMRDKIAKVNGGIPDSLSAKELSFTTQINNLQDQINNTSEEDSLIYTTLSNNLLQTTVEYEDFIRQLEQDFPRYFDLKYNVELAGVDDVKNHLLNNSKALIQYNIVDSLAYVHVISRQSSQFHVLELPKDIDTLINTYYQSMQSRDFYINQSIGSKLYTILFAPIETYLNDTEELIVVPDSWLYYVNMESLPLDNPETPFLLNNYQIQYCYSPTVAVQMKKRPLPSRSDLEWVGFVPGFTKINGTESSNDFTYQPWATELGDSISSKFEGKLFKGDQADRESFILNASSGSILHVGTHAVADDEDPLNSYMVLSGENGQYEKITAADIFNKKIESKCTVLTACETAIGQIKGGEGMVSLARSFSYAGSPNLVVTLWSVDDQQTARIVKSFYEYVSQNFTFDQALRLAKLDYLESVRGELKHPFYWAGILYFGTDEQLHTSFWNAQNVILLSFVLLLIILTAILLRRKQIKEKSLLQ